MRMNRAYIQRVATLVTGGYLFSGLACLSAATIRDAARSSASIDSPDDSDEAIVSSFQAFRRCRGTEAGGGGLNSLSIALTLSHIGECHAPSHAFRTPGVS